MYYLDNNFVIRDLCFTNGTWSSGQLGDALGIKAAPGAGLAATLLPTTDKFEVHIYYQAIDPREYRSSWFTICLLNHPEETQARSIRQLVFDGTHWHKRNLQLRGSLADTSLAVVAYIYGGETHIRVFYQAKNLSLKDHLFNESGWKAAQYTSFDVISSAYW